MADAAGDTPPDQYSQPDGAGQHAQYQPGLIAVRPRGPAAEIDESQVAVGDAGASANDEDSNNSRDRDLPDDADRV